VISIGSQGGGTVPGGQRLWEGDGDLRDLSLRPRQGEPATWDDGRLIPYGYESIPINTIFRGMNIHFTSYFDVHQGYKVLTHCHTSTWGYYWSWRKMNHKNSVDD